MSKNDEIKINIIKGKKKREKEKVIIKKKKNKYNSNRQSEWRGEKGVKGSGNVGF